MQQFEHAGNRTHVRGVGTRADLYGVSVNVPD
jgi:hypothetical protein